MPDPGLQLEHFLPYRLSVLANTISGSLAGAYAQRFELRIPEWRVLAVLGNFPGSSARQVAERTAMDKVAVSRAIASLIDRGRVKRGTDPADRRRSVLSLTSRGRRLLARIAPLARQYEQRLLSQLCPEDQATLDRLLATLLARARELPAEDGQRQGT